MRKIVNLPHLPVRKHKKFNLNVSHCFFVTQGVKKACEELLERMKPVRDELNNPEWKVLVRACQSKLVELSCKSTFRKGDIQEYAIYGCSCAEIELDLLTGNVQLKRVDVLEDTGESMSPGIDVGQVEGAFIMGIGYWLTESIVYGQEKGELLTNRTWNYKAPGAKDIPIDFRVKFLRNSSNPTGVLRSKGMYLFRVMEEYFGINFQFYQRLVSHRYAWQW